MAVCGLKEQCVQGGWAGGTPRAGLCCPQKNLNVLSRPTPECHRDLGNRETDALPRSRVFTGPRKAC